MSVLAACETDAEEIRGYHQRIRTLEAELASWETKAGGLNLEVIALKAELAERDKSWKRERASLEDSDAKLDAARAERDALKAEKAIWGEHVCFDIVEAQRLKARVAELEDREIPETKFGILNEIQDCLTYVKQLLNAYEGGGRESGWIPPEGESGTVSPPTGRTASAANPAVHELDEECGG